MPRFDVSWPETLVRWHRAGFRRYWRWKSRNLGGRPLKLGFAVAQSTVAKYMARTDGRPSGQSWGTFLRNHLPQMAAMDLFVVPTHRL